MQVICLGATRTVTGSCFRVQMDSGDSFLVDCGMFQGGRQVEMRNLAVKNYAVPDLKGIFITHAHIDHSGLVPRLVRQGYRGPVYATAATGDLLNILWLDSAHIQEMESEWQSRKNKRKGRAGIPPLYETVDAEEAIKLLVPVNMDEPLEPIPGVRAQYVTAGHILGAASLHLTLNGRGGAHRVGFSGDIGRPGQLIVPDAERLPKVDTIFMETTYGNRRHKTLVDSITELIGVVKEAYQAGGKVIIPAFAVERTQEIIYTLARAYERGDMPKDMPVFVDSPLAIKSTEIFRQHPEFFDEVTQDLLGEGKTPINLPTLKFTRSTNESRDLNEYAGPAVIIAGSGMANAGRIKHHLKHNLWRPNCHVVIVGFQAQGTTGRRLVEGAAKVKIFREEVAVKAKVHTIGGFSAHADQTELIEWLTPQVHSNLTVNLIHGEEQGMMAFKDLASARFPEVKFHMPQWREAVQLKAGALTPEQAPASMEDRAVQAWKRAARIEKLWSQGEAALNPAGLAALEKALDLLERAEGGRRS